MDEMIDALVKLIRLKQERDKAFADCDSSWGYYGYDIEKKLEEAKQRYAKALTDYLQVRLDETYKAARADLIP